jgi:phage recombination protein Bet
MREEELLAVLGSSLYPGAHPDSIRMVLGYCKASGLDPMQKPVHIVPMWDGKLRQMRDVVMPGIGLYRTQAARNGCAGVSEPEFGPDVTEDIGGAKTTYPAWCKVTVKRRISTGEIVEFTAKEFWRENYAVKGGQDKSVAPNAMWSKRPYGQIAKCAEAQALRKAFPEIGSEPTADEMEGKVLHADEPIRHTPLPSVSEVIDVLEAGRAEIIREAADKAVSQFEAGNEIAAYEEVSGITEVDEKLYLWNYLKPHSKLRASLKRMAAADAVAPKEAA